MRKKFLHVALIVASMAVIFCVSAFAEAPYGWPDGYTDPPAEVSSYSYVFISGSGTRVLWYSDNPDAVFKYDGGKLWVGPTSAAGVLGYTSYNSNSSWGSLIPFNASASVDRGAGIILFSNTVLYDKFGNVTYTPPAPPPPPDPYENFWSDLKEVGTGVLDWAGNVASTITAEPVLLFTVGIFILGAAIGIFRRLLVRG